MYPSAPRWMQNSFEAVRTVFFFLFSSLHFLLKVRLGLEEKWENEIHAEMYGEVSAQQLWTVDAASLVSLFFCMCLITTVITVTFFLEVFGLKS